jgi:hypothetical protein
MFVRWQARKRASRAFGVGLDTDTHWAAILAESARINGKPTQHYVAYLGGITHSAIEIAAQRAFFWKEVMHQLDQLANRVLKDDRARIEEVIARKYRASPGKSMTDALPAGSRSQRNSERISEICRVFKFAGA